MVVSAEYMFLFPVYTFLAGAILLGLAGSLKSGRIFFSAISLLTAISAITTLIPFLFFSQPRIVGYFGNFLLFRIEPFASAAALCLSVSAAGFCAWLTVHYHEPAIARVFMLLLLAMSFAMASLFAANLPSMIFFTSLTFLALFFLRKKAGFGN